MLLVSGSLDILRISLTHPCPVNFDKFPGGAEGSESTYTIQGAVWGKKQRTISKRVSGLSGECFRSEAPPSAQMFPAARLASRPETPYKLPHGA